MKTQDEILERMKTTRATQDHANAILYLFLDRAHQVQLFGKRLTQAVPGITITGVHEPLELADVGPMVVDLLSQMREWEPTAGNDHNERVQEMRRQRLRALLWLVGDEDDPKWDWNKPIVELVGEISARYG